MSGSLSWQACLFKHYDVTLSDLPPSCPRPGQPLWNAHPKVYLPIQKTGHAVCPYCGSEFFLLDTD